MLGRFDMPMFAAFDILIPECPRFMLKLGGLMLVTREITLLVPADMPDCVFFIIIPEFSKRTPILQNRYLIV